MKYIYFIFSFSLLLSINTNGQNNLDSSFGNLGYSWIGAPDINFPADILIQPDNRILIAGSYGVSQWTFAFETVRLDENGNPDSTFDNDGIAICSFTGFDQACGIVLRPDGKIIVGGGGAELVRYNNDGSLDSSFGSFGSLVTNIQMWTNAMAMQSDLKIIMTGAVNNNFYTARFNEDGSIDSSFNFNGIISSNITGTAYSVKIQADGKIVILGEYTDSISNGTAIFRYNSDGSSDTLFGNLGIIKCPLDTLQAFTIKGLTIQPDGKILIGGAITYNTPAQLSDYILMRYQNNGFSDSTFGTNGTAKINHLPFASSGYANSLCIQPDGKIIISGSDLLRLNSDGTLDTSFGNSGFISLLFIGGRICTLQQNGDIIVAGEIGGMGPTGHYESNIVVSRFINNLNLGLIDINETNNYLIYPNPIHDHSQIEFELNHEQQITITIFDMSGNIVQSPSKKKYNIGNNIFPINIDNLNSGEYLVEIKNEKGQRKSILIFKYRE